jgi:hypothetical protein
VIKRLLAATAVALLWSVDPTAQSAGAQVQSQESKEKEKIVTVTGCLRAGEEPNTFVLTNVKWRSQDKTGSSTTGTTGATGTEDSQPAPVTLRLVGAPSGVRMSENVGHTVEITGVLVDEAQPRPTVPTPDPVATGTGGDQTSRTKSPQQTPKSEQTLNVRTVKMLEEGCTGRYM